MYSYPSKHLQSKHINTMKNMYVLSNLGRIDGVKTMSNEKEKHVQCLLTQDEINKLRAVTNKGTTYEALEVAVKHTIATYDPGV